MIVSPIPSRTFATPAGAFAFHPVRPLAVSVVRACLAAKCPLFHGAVVHRTGA